MDSSFWNQLPSPKSLKSLACDVKYPHGNYLIHQLVLNCSKRRKSLSSESDIRAALRSFPGSRVNARNEKGFTALHLAVMKRSSFMVKMLLTYLPTTDVNAKCVYYEGTALHLAAAEDYSYWVYPSDKNNNYGKTELDKDVEEECLEIVNVLLASGAVIDTKNYWGQTPLHDAARGNRIDIVKLLISNGAKLNIKNNRGETALHHAMKVSGLETVKLLVESGANLNEKSRYGFTPFHFAVENDLRDIIEYLISKNVDLNAKEDNSGRTPLYSAVQNGSLKTVNSLLRNGAVLNWKDNRGQTPLHIAAEKRQIDVMKVLISNGAELNIKDAIDGKTPLVAAIQRFSFEKGNREAGLETVKLLVESGADINKKCNYSDSTPFHWAVKANLRGIIKYLISKNVDLNTADKSGMTPLHSAVERKYLETVKDLVRSGALLNSKNNRGETPLHLAAKWNLIDFMKVLVSSGADVSAENLWGRTPLHEAMDHRDFGIWEECLQAVEILVESGADVKAEDKGGKTALSIADTRNYADIVDLLKKGRRVAANVVVDSGAETYFPEAASSNAAVSRQPPFKKTCTSDT